MSILRPPVSSSGDPALVNIARAPVSIGEAIPVAVSASLVRALSPNATEIQNERLSIPVIIWGQELPQTTQHTFDAITGYNMSGFYQGYGVASPLLAHIYNPKEDVAGKKNDIRAWLDDILPTKSGYVRDEYPYATTIPGGEYSYQLHKVSVRYVPDYEQGPVKDIKRANTINYVLPQSNKLRIFLFPRGS